MKNRKVLLIFFLSIFFLIGMTLVAYVYSQNVILQVLCQTTACVGRDPKDNKCNFDAVTITSKKFVDITFVELRYSFRCDASWARATVPPYSSLYVEDPNGKQYGRALIKPDNIASAHFGDMGSGKNVKACAEFPDKKIYCTDFTQ
jgi:Protein of unknown function (DUF2690)